MSIRERRACQSLPAVGASSPTTEALGKAAFKQTSSLPPLKGATVTPGGSGSGQVASESALETGKRKGVKGTRTVGSEAATHTCTEDPSELLSAETESGKPIRPQALSFRAGEPAPSGKAAAAAAVMDWHVNSLSAKNCEGSATSDEEHPRLVPRRGAGPDLRSSGREIDEYLMRLLNAGSVNASEAAYYQNEVSNKPAPTSVAFPAGWNNAKPWFEAAGQQQAAARAGGSGGSGGSGGGQGAGAGVRPTMPPPAFPAQPWQGSRLGPLPPIGPYPTPSPHLDEATQLPGESSCGGAVSEGGSGGGTSAGQSRERAKSPTAPLSSLPMQEQDKELHKQQHKKQQPVAQRLRERMGGEGYEKAGATMLAQQDILRQQVADLHRLVRRQATLMEEAARPAVLTRQKSGAESIAAQDPRSVLLSSLGGGDGASGSMPSSNASAGATAFHNNNNNASSRDPAAAAAAAAGEGGASWETMRVAALARRSQQLRDGGHSVTVAAQGDSKQNRPSLDSNASEQMGMGGLRVVAPPAGMCNGSNVTYQQLQEADARLRSVSLELSQGGSPLAAGSPMVAALSGGHLLGSALNSFQQQMPTMAAQSDASMQQQHAAFAQQSAAGQRQFQEQLMFPAGGQQAGSAWFAEAMRQMQQQSCMAAFDPRFFPWFYQPNLAMSTMSAAGYNSFSAVGMGPGNMWQQGMGMFPAGPSGNYGGQPQGANSSMQGMYGGCNMPQAQQQQQQQEQEGRCNGESAASQESARDSSYQNPAPGASVAQKGATASGDDEATSTPTTRGKKRKAVRRAE
ncbi:hypothetical protein COCOBI_12-2010 [Coccomyxa sp. Obi]|nr:hypothetical protein COCOBI_12-2010 [Coccomyxa sp. Obi]